MFFVLGWIVGKIFIVEPEWGGVVTDSCGSLGQTRAATLEVSPWPSSGLLTLYLGKSGREPVQQTFRRVRGALGLHDKPRGDASALRSEIR